MSNPTQRGTMKIRTAVAAIATAGLLLTACGPSTGSEQNLAAPGADATGTLQVWLMDGSQPQSVIDGVADEFKNNYPMIDVQVELQQWEDIQDRLTASLGTDASPDVVEIGNSVTAKFADAGQLADLTSQAENLGVPNMLPGLAASGLLNDARFAIPYHGGVRVVVYSKSAFKAAGIKTAPQTLAELETAAAKLAAANQANKKYSPFYFPGKYWPGAIPFVWMRGGEIATQDGGRWTGALDSAAAQEGLTTLKNLVRKYSRAPEDGDETANMDAFQSGNVGMMIDSWWSPGALDTGKQRGDIGVFALPGISAERSAPVFMDGSDLAISAKSEQKALATQFVALMTGTATQTLLAEEGGVIPNQAAAFTGLKGNKFLTVAAAAAKNSQFTPVSPNWGNVESSGVLQDMLVDIFTGTESVSAATREASEQITTILNG
ncbi:MAG: extracellular solute-binding protein [Candidatus Nanopelagicales bacterium]